MTSSRRCAPSRARPGCCARRQRCRSSTASGVNAAERVALAQELNRAWPGVPGVVAEVEVGRCYEGGCGFCWVAVRQ